MNENNDKFINSFRTSVQDGTFIKLTLGNYKGPDKHLQKIQVRLISTRRGTRLYFLYRSDARDTAKNYHLDDAVEIVMSLLANEFYSAHLFTTGNDIQLDIGKNGRSRLNIGKPTFKVKPSPSHDREKRRWVDQSAFYLKALGITNDEGRVRDRAQDKWRQINKFVEIFATLFDGSQLKDARSLNFVDMGSGKGYLTFAAYDHFRNVRGLDVQMTGVDVRQELVTLSNEIAAASDFDGLRFLTGSIEAFDLPQTNILLSLHACNTATDEAIWKGIRAGASLIVVAPCCHQELRPQISAPPNLRDTLKHGVMMERMAEFLTDSIRTLLLERSGYSTKVLEFVSLDHTPKNLLICGTRKDNNTRRDDIDRQIDSIFDVYGIRQQRLESLLRPASVGITT